MMGGVTLLWNHGNAQLFISYTLTCSFISYTLTPAFLLMVKWQELVEHERLWYLVRYKWDFLFLILRMILTYLHLQCHMFGENTWSGITKHCEQRIGWVQFLFVGSNIEERLSQTTFNARGSWHIQKVISTFFSFHGTWEDPLRFPLKHHCTRDSATFELEALFIGYWRTDSVWQRSMSHSSTCFNMMVGFRCKAPWGDRSQLSARHPVGWSMFHNGLDTWHGLGLPVRLNMTLTAPIFIHSKSRTIHHVIEHELSRIRLEKTPKTSDKIFGATHLLPIYPIECWSIGTKTILYL